MIFKTKLLIIWQLALGHVLLITPKDRVSVAEITNAVITAID